MRKRSISGLSVFAVASFIVYLFSSLESLPSVASAIDFSWVANGQKQHVNFPYFWVTISIFHTLIAARLYTHAWAIDQSRILGEWLTTDGHWIIKAQLYAEWLLRGTWVALVSYLPTAFGKVVTEERSIFGMTLEFYYVAIFLLVFIWDMLMYRKIINSPSSLAFVNRGDLPREYNIRTLKTRWIGFDLGLLATAVAIALFDAEWLGEWENYKPLVYSFLVMAASVMCVLQMIIWVPEILSARELDSAQGDMPAIT